MRKVKFLFEKIYGTEYVKYPDLISFFFNTEFTDDGFVIADYSGTKSSAAIPDYIPEPIPTISIFDIVAENPEEADLVYWDPSKNFLAIPVGVKFVATATIINFPYDETWNTPLLRNGIVEGYALTSNVGTALTMKGSFVLPGPWSITQEEVNKGMPDNLRFVFPEVTAKVSS